MYGLGLNVIKSSWNLAQILFSQHDFFLCIDYQSDFHDGVVLPKIILHPFFGSEQF